ncbi:helix-turn-helix domain-containing protein [Streptomyces sp. BE20]|uniref:helix-turn-helix domain-containing protein n=1 Tax=Streptomycetaceae TaxID=2062 RepID=UPI002E76DB4F|nr:MULTISPECIES: helix-turn-helix domain-containing protein [unclassified Streptomyces]MED7952647.1 helix-turn-helix domain-containing protein [Streptomyces sp. BE303]MEE1824216.1 helix-turn-helix domain-containing protein [Streptomyces sp. BE20]
MPEYYSVEQVAELLGLHVRTVRGYVRDGRLRATRIGKQYRIARRDFESFAGADPEASAPPEPGPLHVEVSTVVQIDGVGVREAVRLSNTLVALVSGPRGNTVPTRVESLHNEERATLKVIILGDPADTAELLAVIHSMTTENRHV